MVQWIAYFYGFCTIIFNCSGQLNFNSSLTKKFRELLVLRSEMVLSIASSASMLEQSKFRQMSANSKQWTNYKMYSSKNCPSSNIVSYASFSSKIVGKTTSCSNDGDSSSEIYSITNSIPPLPAGLLQRYQLMYILTSIMLYSSKHH